MKSYRLAIFDLDGTLLDTLEDLANATNHVLAQMGYPTRTVEEVRRFVGNGIRNLISRALPEGVDEAEITRAFELFLPYYQEHSTDCTRPYEGIPELLARLRTEGYRIVILSNKADAAVRSLCERYFQGLYDLCRGERAGVAKKPAPDAVYEILSEMNVPKEAAVFIGDSEVDVLTAKNAGVALFCVDWGFRSADTLRQAGAERIISDTGSLLNALIKI